MEPPADRADAQDRGMDWGFPDGLEVVAASTVDRPAFGHASILRGHSTDFLHHEQPAHSVAFMLSGSSTIEWKIRGRLRRFVAAPGGFTVSPVGGDSAFAWGRPVETLNLGIQSTQLDLIAGREFGHGGRPVELVPVHQNTTPEVVALGQSFAALLRSPRRGSGLYAETLWVQIAVQLLWNFSSLTPRYQPEPGRLSDARFRRVAEFLEATLHEEVSLSDLADVAGLSVTHFVTAFKKSTGSTPHRYLTERRVARACELLRNPVTPIVSVALAVGFSSQSHFTTVFRRFMKVTPAAYRAQILGLWSNP